MFWAGEAVEHAALVRSWMKMGSLVWEEGFEAAQRLEPVRYLPLYLQRESQMLEYSRATLWYDD